MSTGRHSAFSAIDSLEELANLAETAEAIVVDKVIQQRSRLDPATYIGKGKAQTLAATADHHQAQTIIFDDDLSPAQVRNLEQITKKKIVDRTGLILDIFAGNARTKEAMTQVELAQLNYLLPRLTGHWSHFSRQVGGIGVRGPGETQLETDRRLVRKRIAKLNRDLKRIERERKTQSKRRSGLFRTTLIGYTNAGKSTLLNALTRADVLVENKLFATLDSTIRRLNLGNNLSLLISDTVGFIRRLPHHLVASFRSTLSEIRDANLLLHVIDAGHPAFEFQIKVVDEVLHDLEVDKIPVIQVFNKIDALKDTSRLHDFKTHYPEGVFMSAKRGIGLQQLLQRMHSRVHESFPRYTTSSKIVKPTY